jgi:hypothetical protein
VTFNAYNGVPYRLWFRLRARSDRKANDSIWVQLSDALVAGTPAYRTNTTSGLVVNLATSGSGGSLRNWGWTNGAYWMTQANTVTFETTGAHTIRIQPREDGVEVDQIVLSPVTYFGSAPGGPTNDATVVAK